MSTIAGMGGHERVGRADQSKNPTAGMVEIDQLDQYVGRLGRGVLILAEFGFELDRLPGRSVGRRLLSICRKSKQQRSDQRRQKEAFHLSLFLSKRLWSFLLWISRRSGIGRNSDFRRFGLNSCQFSYGPSAKASEIFFASAAIELSGKSANS